MDGSNQEDLLSAILEGRLDDASGLLTQAARSVGYASMVATLLEPTLFKIGELWSSENISLAQGYVAGKLAERVLTEAAEAGEGSVSASPKGSVVLGNVEDDYHALGRRMVASFLRLDGWTVHDLGNDVDAAAFVNAALKTGSAVIGASSMMLTTARNLPRLRREIDGRGLGGSVKLAVGGAIFRLRPDLIRELGGDGSSATAMEAPALFRELAGAAKR